MQIRTALFPGDKRIPRTKIVKRTRRQTAVFSFTTGQLFMVGRDFTVPAGRVNLFGDFIGGQRLAEQDRQWKPNESALVDQFIIACMENIALKMKLSSPNYTSSAWTTGSSKARSVETEASFGSE